MARVTGHRASQIGLNQEVTDQTKLTQFLKKRGEWFEVFENDKQTAVCIRNQLIQAIVDDLTYRVFLAEATDNQKGNAFAIPSLRYLLNVGYATSQALLARRLLDSRKDVSSIARITRDIRKHRKLITRENFVSYDGTPYDPDLSHIGDHRETSVEYQVFGLHGPGFANQLRSHHRHEKFDLLSNVQPASRTRRDVVDPRILSTIAKWSDSPEALRLKEISDSRFAHASDGSHSTFRDESGNIALLEVENAHRGFILSSRALFDVVLNSENHSEVAPHIPLGAFGPVWDTEQVIESTARMQKRWDELVDQRNAWAKDVDQALYDAAFQ